MNTDSQTPAAAPAQPTLQLRAARAAIARELGAEKLAELHKGNLALDIAAIAGSIGLFLACAWVLGTFSIREPLWWLCLVVQGDLVLVMAFINHDAFVHRKLFPTPLRWVLSSVLVWPSQLRGAVYEQAHLTHHRQLGTEHDSEAYKMDIDTWWKRILYATPALMVYRAFFLKGRTASVGQTGVGTGTTSDPRRHRWEKATRLVLLALAAGIAIADWRLIVFGYLLPFAVVTPAFNTMRIVLEHLDLDRGNPLWVGTFYRTGFFTRLMFWWDAGDCHLVHHFHANIPFYRMGRALELMRPLLIQAGVLEQVSLPRLLGQWFSGSRAHWSVPAGPKLPPSA